MLAPTGKPLGAQLKSQTVLRLNTKQLTFLRQHRTNGFVNAGHYTDEAVF